MAENYIVLAGGKSQEKMVPEAAIRRKDASSIATVPRAV